MLKRILTKEQIDELKEVFQLFDQDKNGVITLFELSAIMKLFDKPYAELEAIEIMNRIDRNNDGGIDFDRFAGLIAQHIGKNRTLESDLKAFFDVLDSDKDGKIKLNKITQAVNDIQYQLKDFRIEQIFSSDIPIHDDEISFEEFKSMMRKCLSYV